MTEPLDRRERPVIEAVVQEYTISSSDFQPAAAPQELVDWKIGDTITRANFLDMLIKSFAISRGIPGAQILFFEWLRVQNGFDYVATLDNFLGQGGWSCFSAEERQKFLFSFQNVKKHTDKWQEWEHEDEAKNEIANLPNHFVPSLRVHAARLPGVNLKDLENFSDFLEVVNNYIADVKNI